MSRGTVGFLIWYFGAFLGASLIRSGICLARRLRTIDRQIEDEALRESLSGGRKRSRAELEQRVNVPKQSVWSQIHTLYIAPLVVGIVLWLIAKALA